MSTLKSYFSKIFKQVLESPKEALFPDGDLKGFWKAYVEAYLKTWLMRGFAGGLLGFGLARLFSNEYFSEAVKQAISSELWNVIVAFGFICVLVGVVAKLIHFHWLAQHALESAKALLVFASEAGAIAYGVLLAMLIFAIVDSDFGNLWVYLYTGLGLFLMLFVALVNILVFWVLHCLQYRERLPSLFETLRLNPLFCGILCLFLTSLLLTLTITTTPLAPPSQMCVKN